MCSNYWTDPGPCPVCDAPHTTCTSPDYVRATRGGLTVAIQPPRSLAGTLRALSPVVEPPALEPAPTAPAVTTGDEVVTFTTSEYQRADHGKRLRLRQTRKAKP